MALEVGVVIFFRTNRLPPTYGGWEVLRDENLILVINKSKSYVSLAPSAGLRKNWSSTDLIEALNAYGTDTLLSYCPGWNVSCLINYLNRLLKPQKDEFHSNIYGIHNLLI